MRPTKSTVFVLRLRHLRTAHVPSVVTVTNGSYFSNYFLSSVFPFVYSKLCYAYGNDGVCSVQPLHHHNHHRHNRPNIIDDGERTEHEPFDAPISNDNAIVSVSDLKQHNGWHNGAECKQKMTRKHNGRRHPHTHTQIITFCVERHTKTRCGMREGREMAAKSKVRNKNTA